MQLGSFAPLLTSRLVCHRLRSRTALRMLPIHLMAVSATLSTLLLGTTMLTLTKWLRSWGQAARSTQTTTQRHPTRFATSKRRTVAPLVPLARQRVQSRHSYLRVATPWVSKMMVVMVMAVLVMV